jgi:hypothetical protein
VCARPGAHLTKGSTEAGGIYRQKCLSREALFSFFLSFIYISVCRIGIN